MAQITNTFSSYDAKGNREDLSDLIDMISPEETPFYSLIGDTKASATKKEWQVDSLATPNPDNARVEGDAYSFSSVSATTRVGNFTQIFMKEFIISETEEAVDKAGRKSEVAYQKTKKGQEIKTDIETAFLKNQASVAGDDSTARRLGGLRAWIATNDSLGGTGASGGYNSTTGVVDAATDGTQRAFTKTLLDDTIQATYMSGGNPTILMVSPYVKRVFSTFMSDSNVAAFRTNVSGKAGTLVGAADAYLSDFGLIDVVPNRQMARVGASLARNAFLIDPTKAHKGWLRKIQEDKEVAKTGDGLPTVMKAEVTLEVNNEAAHGVVADLFGMTSST